MTDASVTWGLLLDAIVAAGGPAYQYRQIDPVDDQDGGEPGGNIRVGFLFRTDRGLSFVDRPGGTPTTATTVIDHPAGPRLSFSPGRVAPQDPAFVDTRKSLTGEFYLHGRKVFVVATHFSSKSDDDPLFGRWQPPVRSSEPARHSQAQVVNDFVDQLVAADPQANVIVLGDINDFEFSETVQLLEGGVLTTLMDTLSKAERYSYVFEGNSQVLDQILVSTPCCGPSRWIMTRCTSTPSSPTRPPTTIPRSPASTYAGAQHPGSRHEGRRYGALLEEAAPRTGRLEPAW